MRDPKIKGYWVVAGGAPGELGHCTRCGAGLNMEMPQPVLVVTMAMEAFVKAHTECKEHGYKEPVPTGPWEWVKGRDTGVSSCTIWSVAMEAGSRFGRYDVPHDPTDFGRCYRLLKLFPEWVALLPKVANRFPKWGPMVREWEKLTALYEEELPNDTAPKLYALMQELEEEGEKADVSNLR